MIDEKYNQIPTTLHYCYDIRPDNSSVYFSYDRNTFMSQINYKAKAYNTRPKIYSRVFTKTIKDLTTNNLAHLVTITNYHKRELYYNILELSKPDPTFEKIEYYI